MIVTYRFLEVKDLEKFLNFCLQENITLKLFEWVAEGLAKATNKFKVSAEFINEEINGVMIACSIGYFLKASEFAPTWIGFSINRKITVYPSFSKFMHLASSLIADNFESIGYFHHYISRKLYPRDYSNLQLSKITNRVWAQGPYDTIVERKIESAKDLAEAPSLFKEMIRVYTQPVIVLSMNMPNEKRDLRIVQNRTCIFL